MWALDWTWNIKHVPNREFVKKNQLLNHFLGGCYQPSFYVLRVDCDPRYNKWGSPSTLSGHKLIFFVLSLFPKPLIDNSQCQVKHAHGQLEWFSHSFTQMSSDQCLGPQVEGSLKKEEEEEWYKLFVPCSSVGG